jgi:Aminotransferase class-V
LNLLAVRFIPAINCYFGAKPALVFIGIIIPPSFPGIETGMHIALGTARNKAGVLSFVLNNLPNEEVGKLLGREGIAVRAGHHCTQPSLRRFGVEGTVRPSLAFYNTGCDRPTG